MTLPVPVFVVVGYVNRGKSSIVATLAEEESVRINANFPTTKEVTSYPVKVDDRVLFTLVDTPGFQDAPAALEEIRKHRTDASVSADAVKSFVQTYGNSQEFQEETRLLTPILNGGRILYVVDGTAPYSNTFEAEMEILRWTGRPRIALINRIGPGNFVDDWKKALGQYFSIVREFDANRATFSDRIRLLETFRELDDESRAPLQEAIDLMRGDRQRRRRDAARQISSLLIEALRQSIDFKLEGDQLERDRRDEALQRLQDNLRTTERRIHRNILEIYKHPQRRVKSDDLDIEEFKDDLFSERTWQIYGLTHGQLLVVGALGGAAAGLAVDVAAGGHTFLLASIVGGVIGGTSAFLQSSKRIGSAKELMFQLAGGARVVRFGPLSHPKLPSLVLDRALDAFRRYSTLSHSVQGEIAGPVQASFSSIVRELPPQQQKEIEKLFARIRKSASISDDLHHDLRVWIEKRMQAIDPS